MSTRSQTSWRGIAPRLGCAVLAVAAAVELGPAVAGRRADGQERAEQAPLAVKSLLLGAAVRDGRIIAVGERGHVLVSRDAGVTWTQSDVPTRTLLTAVTMIDGTRGWAVGHDSVVIRTQDGGASWTRVHVEPEAEKPLFDVWFADATHGLAVGAYGTVLTTSDGGDSWAAGQVHGDDDAHLNHLAAAADGTMYLAAEAGHLYRSDDRGATWQAMVTPYHGSFFGVLPGRDGTVLAFGLRGHLYRSADRGATWTELPTGTDESLTCALDLGGGRFVVGGMAGTLLWSDAAGTTVRRQDLPDRKAVMALLPGPPNTVLLFGEGGVKRVDIPR